MQKRDATGKLGLSTLQKVIAAHRILAYGTSVDATEEYIRIGSNNDINVLQSSNLFDKLAHGIAPPANYTIFGKDYDTCYYLADGIYPKWPTLVQTIAQPQGPKKQYFAAMQEGYRKDMERAFGVLQDKRVLHDIMTACVILHNMIVVDEREEELDNVDST
ncbi:uncharacterized protein LOC109838223 [Asparagus officinalis]|uniref:uncharacterized protein LOC109838223 n=1 Tax=Asparagus officinalis TaxID=4686 RepID=UPI00098DE7BC|nr:uncharacterized protein LOC109838223 [Asparagus officinalis]